MHTTVGNKSNDINSENKKKRTLESRGQKVSIQTPALRYLHCWLSTKSVFFPV